jgi:hypothetical protein
MAVRRATQFCTARALQSTEIEVFRRYQEFAGEQVMRTMAMDVATR